ncbi:11632_t:CDS:10 [Ambispora leptoticha]|uniref:11632_t:CDS:1 n=1 Tax=Ambispora leptoticha TaxID=144679 RepID=A0A9N9A735_9GLOM|nr:11632_t:CDS:10 [Ambispora leptoticha]
MSNLPPLNDPERDVAERQALGTKVKMEEVVEAFSEGKLPTTKQITETITKVQESETLHDVSHQLSPLGRKILSDTEKLLDTTKRVLKEKNRGEQLQNLIFYGGQTAKSMGDKVPTDIPEDLKAKARGETDKTTELVKEGFSKGANVARLLITRPEFRRLIGDLHSLIQEAIAKGFDKIDQTIQKSREVAGAEDPTAATGDAMQDVQENIENTRPTDRAQEAAEAYKAGDIDKATERAGYKMTREQRENLVNRFKNLMIQTQSTPEYQEAIQDLINIISHISDKTQELTAKVAEASEPLTEEARTPSVDEVERNAKELIENFANHRSLDNLIAALKEFSVKVRTHDELYQYFDDLREFALKSLLDVEFVKNTDYTSRGSDLIERGRVLLLEQYGDITQNISREAALFNKGLQEDSTTTQLKKDLEVLTKDLFLDDKNRPAFKFELIKDIAKIIQVLGAQFNYIALPRIEHADDQNEYIFDNIVLHIPQLVARHIHLNLTADIDLDRQEDQVLENTITLDITKIAADARNIAFFYRQKGSFVKWMDVGHIDFAVPEESGGLCLHMKLMLNANNDDTTPSTFQIVELHSRISELKFRLHNTKHDTLYKFITPLYEKRIKKQIENSINDMLRNAINYIDEQICTIKRKSLTKPAQEAEEEELEEPTQKQPWQSSAFDPRLDYSIGVADPNERVNEPSSSTSLPTARV